MIIWEAAGAEILIVFSALNSNCIISFNEASAWPSG